MLNDKEWLENEYKTKTYAQIASEIGSGETAVYNAIKRHGIKSRSRSERLRGRKFTYNHRKRLSEAKKGTLTGEDNPNWKGGVTKERWMARHTNDAANWKAEVLRRAGDKCAKCGRVKGERCKCCKMAIPFYIHHIKSFSEHPELRYDPDNGEVLCHYCHVEEHKK